MKYNDREKYSQRADGATDVMEYKSNGLPPRGTS